MTIRVGLIGLNYGARVHLPVYKAHPKYEVVAVCARTPGRAEKAARENQVARAYTDARELINDQNVDLVSIASPPGTHAGYAAAALAARKHVVVEIGFVCDAPDARVLAVIAREQKRVGTAAYVLRYTPLLRHVTDLLAAQPNPMGRLRLMRFDSFSNFLARPDQGYRWIWDGKNGGGILWNFTSHAIDLALRWLGPVREVDGALTTFARVDLPRSGKLPSRVGLLAKARVQANPPAPADDTGFVTLHFENGAIATFSHSAVTAYPRTHLELHGSEASLLIEGFGDEAALLKMGEEESEPLFPPPAYLEESRGQSGLEGGFRVFLDRLAIPIEGGEPPADLPTFAQGWEVARVL
ncbi:MAG: Gfo/Idh/MocA family protein, partial [Anaerolineales bacterium]